MKKVHLLNLGNPRRVKENLSGILGQPELDKIESEIIANTVAPYRLVVYPINGTMFGNDYPQQNKLSKCSLKYSIISVVHH